MKCEYRKICRKSESILSFSFENSCYYRNKPEACQNSAPWWTFSFISTNW